MEQNTIGDRIRELRKSKNLTQDDLALLVNSSRVQINQWETGARELPTSRVIDFASALDTSCEYLLRGVTVEKADSYNQTGLDMHSLSAFADIMNLTEHKKKQYLMVLNSILGSDCFWRMVLPHILAAVSIQENSILGGAYQGLKDFKPELLAEQIKESIQCVTFSNINGYMDHIIINKETAIAFQLNEAAEAFKLLIKAIVDKIGEQQNNPLAAYTVPYRANNAPDERINVSEVLEYLKAMGITVKDVNHGRETL